ncbi:arsenate reductase (glutaredoxin) [Sediminibacter sp. Hel_I_10]|uniref:arsenate reductase (glutaredoxin) n=1 Tax=Sediminibacter sp. Hel_I_10 TaxID=1392490 RepID=UPI000479FECA|nr:arsenate reductase (glutaredoxin) [Sediminibacter sp. Hel_I_10]
MIKIYHNARCRKSREGLELLKDSKKDFKVVEYLKDPISEEDLKSILTKLKMSPIDLVRKNESIWKSNFQDKQLSDQDIIEAMLSHPKLIERPIVVNDNKAVIGRPSENILEII